MGWKSAIYNKSVLLLDLFHTNDSILKVDKSLGDKAVKYCNDGKKYTYFIWW